MGTRQIKDLLVELCRRGKTILLSSHLLADVEDVCDRIGILYGGRMQIEGPVRELLQHRGQVQITAGELKLQTREKIEALLREDGSDYQISSPMDKLETFFVNTVARAQKTQPTSGAGAGTGIQGFLAVQPKSPQQEALDRLVSANVHTEKIKEDVQTEKSRTRQETPAAKKELLAKLTQMSFSAEDAKAVTTEKPTAVPAKPAAPIRKDLLEKLAGRDQEPNGQTEKTGDPGPGGSPDA
jgi:ABC-2 type transport system ATP-binding protein